MDKDRRVDTAMGLVVDSGYRLNFEQGYKKAVPFLKFHGVPATVVMRLINYDRRRAPAVPETTGAKA